MIAEVGAVPGIVLGTHRQHPMPVDAGPMEPLDHLGTSPDPTASHVIREQPRARTGLALAKALRKRLRARSIGERDSAAAGVDPASCLRHHSRAGLYESAVRGWDRVIARLAREREAA